MSPCMIEMNQYAQKYSLGDVQRMWWHHNQDYYLIREYCEKEKVVTRKENQYGISKNE